MKRKQKNILQPQQSEDSMQESKERRCKENTKSRQQENSFNQSDTETDADFSSYDSGDDFAVDCESGDSKCSKASSRKKKNQSDRDREFRQKIKNDPIKDAAYRKARRLCYLRQKENILSDPPNAGVIIPRNKCNENNSRKTYTSMSELTDDTHGEAGTKRKRKDATEIQKEKSTKTKEAKSTKSDTWPSRMSVNNSENDEIETYENLRQLSNSPENLFPQRGNLNERKNVKETDADFSAYDSGDDFTTDCEGGDTKCSKASSREKQNQYDRKYRQKIKSDPVKYAAYKERQRIAIEKMKQDPVRYSHFVERRRRAAQRLRHKMRDILSKDVSELSDDPIIRQELLLKKTKYLNSLERKRQNMALRRQRLKDAGVIIPRNKCNENNSRKTYTSMSELTDDTHGEAGTKRKRKDATEIQKEKSTKTKEAKSTKSDTKKSTKTKGTKSTKTKEAPETATDIDNYYGHNENDDELSDNNEYVYRTKNDSSQESSDDSGDDNFVNILEQTKRFENIVNATETEIIEAPKTTHMPDWPSRMSVNNSENDEIEKYENLRHLSNSPENLFPQRGNLFERKKVKETDADFSAYDSGDDFTTDCEGVDTKCSKASSRKKLNQRKYRQKIKSDPVKYAAYKERQRIAIEKMKQDPVRYSHFVERRRRAAQRLRHKMRDILSKDVSELSDDPIIRQELLLKKTKYLNSLERKRQNMALRRQRLKDAGVIIPRNKCNENNSRKTYTSMSELTDDTHGEAGTKRKRKDATEIQKEKSTKTKEAKSTKSDTKKSTKTKGTKSTKTKEAPETATDIDNYYGHNENDDELSDNNEYVYRTKNDSSQESSDDSGDDNFVNILEQTKRFENIVNATETEIIEAPKTTHMPDWPSRMSVNNSENDEIEKYENLRHLSNSPENLFPQRGNLFERKKVKDTIGDFTVDTVQPVANLLEYFEQNKRIYRMCSRLSGHVGSARALSAHFLIPGLPLNTFPEDFDGSLPRQYFEKFQYKCTMPCITTRLNNLTTNDPLTEEIEVKAMWNKAVSYNSTGAIRSSNRTENYTVQKMNENVIYCPRKLLRLAVLLDQDPDPLFDDNYNWFYAGNGNLQVISVNDVDCLLHSELSKVYLSKFSRRKLKTKSRHIALFDCGDGTKILETICNTNNFVTIRLRHKIYILQLTTQENSIKFVKVKEVDSKIPFTSVEFDRYQKHILYITKIDGMLLIVNLELLKCRSLELMKGTRVVNNWNKIINIDALSYCHVSKNAFKIYDKRTNGVVQEFTEFKNLSVIKCDEVTAAKKCEDVPYVFFATNHLAFLMDVRWPSNQKPRLLRRWTHQMQCCPTYISQIKHEHDKELFCLSSQWPEDTCVISNDTNIYNRISLHTSMTIPYRLPSFETTLDEAKNRMLCVDIYHPIEQRVYTTVTGNCVMAADENVIVLTLNSLGDIFAYTVYPEHLDKEDDSVDRLHEWSLTMTKCTREKRIYSSSKIVDIAHVWKSLKQVPGDYVFGDGKLVKNQGLHYNEKEAVGICQSGKVDMALLEAWLDEEPEKDKQTALNIDLHFSDSE